MLHHVSVGVADVERAALFYDAVLGALGYKRVMEYLPYALAYGETAPSFGSASRTIRKMPMPATARMSASPRTARPRSTNSTQRHSPMAARTMAHRARVPITVRIITAPS